MINIGDEMVLLEKGDQLIAHSSWNDLVVTIIDVTEDRAISDRYYEFNRQFKDFDTYINKEIGTSLDYIFWEVIKS